MRFAFHRVKSSDNASKAVPPERKKQPVKNNSQYDFIHFSFILVFNLAQVYDPGFRSPDEMGKISPLNKGKTIPACLIFPI